MKRIDWPLLMRHEHATRALGERLQIGKTPSGTAPILPPTPEAFDRLEVVAAAGWQDLPPTLLVPVGQRRRELLGAVDATAIDDPADLFPDGAKAGHDVMDILSKPQPFQHGPLCVRSLAVETCLPC